MHTIYKRRSIRRYQNRPVDTEKLFEFIKAGMNAPSANNQQPWQFVIIDERSILEKIPEFHPYSQMLKEAPAAILVCGDESLSKSEGYWIQDCAAATENILLEIADQDFGGVWLGIYPREERINGMCALLNLPAHIVPFSLIALGYPAEQKEAKNIFDKSRIKFNGWSY